MPYAADILFAVKEQGLKMALVTGSARHEAEPILKKGLGFYDLFDTVVTKDDVTNPKPAGDPYLLALKNMQVAAKKCDCCWFIRRVLPHNSADRMNTFSASNDSGTAKQTFIT